MFRNKSFIYLIILIILSIPILLVGFPSQTTQNSLLRYAVWAFLKFFLLGTLWGFMYKSIVERIKRKYLSFILIGNMILLAIISDLKLSFLFVLMQIPSFWVGRLLSKLIEGITRKNNNRRTYDVILSISIVLFLTILILAIGFIFSLTGFDITNNAEALP